MVRSGFVKMSQAKFDTLIHAANRLQICALLSNSAEIEFKVLREHLDVSDSVLSKQTRLLEEAGYLKHMKRADLGRQRTWLALSSDGRKAYAAHVNALKEIVGR